MMNPHCCISITYPLNLTLFTVSVYFILLLHYSIAFTNPLVMSSTASAGTMTRTLYDMPISNNGARCRIIIYKKKLENSEVAILSPLELGGLKSEAYLARNPQGKMPLLVDTQAGLNLAESDTIARYLISEYANQGPSFLVDHPISNLMARIHDMYLTTIQSCLYKNAPPFGAFGTRKDAIEEYIKQLKVLEDLVPDGNNMYLLGEEVSLADASIFPSLVFAVHMLPKFLDDSSPLPPKLTNYYHQVTQHDPVFRRVQDEIQSGLNVWEDNKRWDSFFGAGCRDTDPATIFDKIVSGEISAQIVQQPDDKILAFKDINPVAPAHVLLIPKHRSGLTRLTRATAEHQEILGRLLVAAAVVAKDKSLGFMDGARVVINDGPDGGQEIPHLHVHLLGGQGLGSLGLP